MPRSSLPWLPLVAVALLALAGCDREEIQTYEVPKPTRPTDEKVRLLAAVFDVGVDQWYFKLVGPTQEVDKHAEAFAKFVTSTRFTKKGDNPVEWTVPKDWEKGEARKPRFAAFFPDPKDHNVELTVFQFDRVSPLVDNVNRWCDVDLGLPHFRKADVDRLVKPIKAGDKLGGLIDLKGPGARKRGPHHAVAGMGAGRGKDMRRPAPPPDTDPKPAGKSPINYVTPAGWTDTGARGGFVPVLQSFKVSEGGSSADVTVITMPGRTTADPANVNRWRGQVGMSALTAAEHSKLTPREVKVGGEAGQLYEFVGPKQGMLLVLVQRANQTWFFKMMGDADVVNKNRDKFAAFVLSVKFTGAAE
jgi:hypothetical protein